MSSRRQRRQHMRRRLRQRIRHTITHRHRKQANPRRLTQSIHRLTQNRRIQLWQGHIPHTSQKRRQIRIQSRVRSQRITRKTQHKTLTTRIRARLRNRQTRSQRRMTRTHIHRLKQVRRAHIVEYLTHQINTRGARPARKHQHTSRRGRQECAELRLNIR